jgi:hypothetical protein
MLPKERCPIQFSPSIESYYSQSTATSQLLNQKHPTTLASHSDSRLGSGTNRSLRTSTGELNGHFGWSPQLLGWTQAPACHVSTEDTIKPGESIKLAGDGCNPGLLGYNAIKLCRIGQRIMFLGLQGR